MYFRLTMGHFPGAQPPLEFWDGTPIQVDVEVNGKKTKIWDFADTKSKNIQWKARVPGWGLSHPIVVGKKVFAVGHPDFVTCWDLETGKLLWGFRDQVIRDNRGTFHLRQGSGAEAQTAGGGTR